MCAKSERNTAVCVCVFVPRDGKNPSSFDGIKSETCKEGYRDKVKCHKFSGKRRNERIVCSYQIYIIRSKINIFRIKINKYYSKSMPCLSPSVALAWQIYKWYSFYFVGFAYKNTTTIYLHKHDYERNKFQWIKWKKEKERKKWSEQRLKHPSKRDIYRNFRSSSTFLRHCMISKCGRRERERERFHGKSQEGNAQFFMIHAIFGIIIDEDYSKWYRLHGLETIFDMSCMSCRYTHKCLIISKNTQTHMNYMRLCVSVCLVAVYIT